MATERDTTPARTTVGVLGGGQLGRMLALSGRPLGLGFAFLEPSPEPPAKDLGHLIQARFDDDGALDALSAGVDVVTYEFENVPVSSARRVASRVPLRPGAAALDLAQDRLTEKRGFESLGIPVAPFRNVETRHELEAAVTALGVPAMLKTRRMGYDGKGQLRLDSPADVESAWQRLEGRGPLILEAFVDFRRELSLLAVRGMDGAIAFYPLVENLHHQGILRETRAPAEGVSDRVRDAARGHLRALLEELDYVGVLAVEFFETGDGLLANEMAPRVHNSGHWTQDGAECSQFENHLRAVTGLPLGSTEARGLTRMVNLIGQVPPAHELLQVTGAHLHLYEKQPRPGRKLGHVNIIAPEAAELEERSGRVRKILEAE